MFSQVGDAMEYFMKGEIFKLELDFENAINNFITASEIDSNSIIIFNELTECYREIGDHKKVKKYLNKSLINSNYSVDVGIEALNFYNELEDTLAHAELLIELINYNPQNKELLYLKIRSLFDKKEYVEILHVYKNIYLLDPEDGDILPKLVEIALTLNLENYFEKELIEIISELPEKTDPLLALASLKISTKKYSESINYLDIAYQISNDEYILLKLIDLSLLVNIPENIDKYLKLYEENFDLSSTFIKYKIKNEINKKQYYSALKLIVKLIEKDDFDSILYEKYILISNELNELDIAFNKIENQFVKYPQQILFPILLGEINELQNNKNDALDWYLISLNIENQNSFLRHHIANLSESLKQYQLSDSIFNVIISQDQNDASGLNNYAYSLCERDNPDLEYALLLSKKSIKLEPDNAAFLDTIGWIYYKLNKPLDALPFILKSSKIDNKSVLILNHLTEIYLKLNQKKEALEVLNKILDLEPGNKYILNKIERIGYE
jgi:tetratricopeptide (TPR) repeat protein